ncbi:PSD1 and planctomycete cytochrome C domain-containing protein [Roseiconus nitratireducens]|nr:PSD1 and planctomycete cytochrome C domain-containing protein [Roseiconus nitratireducens]
MARISPRCNASRLVRAAFEIQLGRLGQIGLQGAVVAMFMIGVSAGVAAADPIGDEPIRYNDQIRPIFAEHCLHCHGPDESQRQAGLRLDQSGDSLQEVVVAGDPQASTLIERIESDDDQLRMPPPESEKRLSDDQIALLRRWVGQGANYDTHWAFTPIRDSEESTIDDFVQAGLEAQSLTPSETVSRQTLIRRVTFDLTGLPPRWEEVQEFVRDESPEAYSKLIDRLLDSPRYGERWGRHWLDLARYADTHGGSAIGFTKFPYSYTYRDYVIQAFNQDLPYDQFIREQLAADQLGLDEHDPALAALGFLTIGMQYRNPHDVIDDQIDVVTRGLMGLTVACARCHDHKYDPIPTADYYALYATFASSQRPEQPPLLGPPPATPEYEQYRNELELRRTRFEDSRRDQTAVMASRLRMQVGMYLTEIAEGATEQDLSSAFLSYRTDDQRPRVLNRWREYLLEMPSEDPVFGPWVQLREVESGDFGKACQELLQRMREQNGDPATFAKVWELGTVAPRWNPRVLQMLEDRAPKNLAELAAGYGHLFADVHREWLKSLLAASEEAAVDGEIVTDQDQRHATINSAIDSQLRRHLYSPGTPTVMPDELAARLLNRTVRDSLGGKEGAIENLHLTHPASPPRPMLLSEQEHPGAFHVFRRGNPVDRGDPVEPHFLTVLASGNPPAFPAGRRRLALANAITDPSNPLTRRVIVNWVWLHHFGRGLVRTPDDFGTRGQSPTHPKLLDHLANALVEDGWSIKSLHRRILLSRAYRQAAMERPAARSNDPDNRSLWRMPRRRLDLEAMRDAMLAVSGELDTTATGGRPFDFLARPTVPRRSVYGFINRDVPSSLTSTFDGANASACTAKRPETVVPQQTLFALNSEFIQDRAAAFAVLASREVASEPAERVRWMYRRAYSRRPTDQELESSLQFVRAANSIAGGDDQIDSGGQVDAGWQQLAHVLLASNEFVFTD